VRGMAGDPEMKARGVPPTDGRNGVGSSTETNAQRQTTDGTDGVWGTVRRRPLTTSGEPTATWVDRGRETARSLPPAWVSNGPDHRPLDLVEIVLRPIQAY